MPLFDVQRVSLMQCAVRCGAVRCGAVLCCGRQTLAAHLAKPQAELGGFLFRPIARLNTCFTTCRGTFICAVAPCARCRLTVTLARRRYAPPRCPDASHARRAAFGAYGASGRVGRLGGVQPRDVDLRCVPAVLACSPDAVPYAVVWYCRVVGTQCSTSTPTP